MQLNTAEDLGCPVWYFSGGIAVIAKHLIPTYMYIYMQSAKAKARPNYQVCST